MTTECTLLPTGVFPPHLHAVPTVPVPDPARRLDLAADVLLQQGFPSQAERLAHRAAELRGWAV